MHTRRKLLRIIRVAPVTTLPENRVDAASPLLNLLCLLGVEIKDAQSLPLTRRDEPLMRSASEKAAERGISMQHFELPGQFLWKPNVVLIAERDQIAAASGDGLLKVLRRT